MPWFLNFLKGFYEIDVVEEDAITSWQQFNSTTDSVEDEKWKEERKTMQTLVKSLDFY